MYDPARIAHYFQLVVAIQTKQLSIVEQLVRLDLVDINFINLYDRNRTLIHDAVLAGDPKIVSLLLSHGADTEAADLNGKKPFEFCSELSPAEKKAVEAVLQEHFSKTKRGGRPKPEEVVRSDVLCFTKRPGTAAVGQYYETKLLTMVLFRALRDDRIVSFCLGNNLDEAGAFDDVVLRYKMGSGEPDRLVCLQAKHRDDRKRVEFKDLIDEKVTKGDLHMLKYFQSYLKIRLVCSTSRDAIFEGIFKTTEVELILFTTAGFNFTKNVEIFNTQKANIWYTKEAGKTSQVKCTDTMRQFFKAESSKWYQDIVSEVLARLLVSQKLDTSNLEDAIQKLGVTTLDKLNELDLLAILNDQMGRNVQEVKKIIKPILDNFSKLLLSKQQHEALVENFFSVLRLYTEQATEQELDEVIRDDLKGHYREDVFLKAHETVQSWWKQSGQVPFLTKQCQFFEKAAKEIELDKWSSNYVDRIKGFGVKFNDEMIRNTEWVGVLDKYLKQEVFCLNLISSTPELSCLRLIQFFEQHKEFNEVVKQVNLSNCKVDDFLINVTLSEPNCLILTSKTALTCEIVEKITASVRKFVFVTPLKCTGDWRSIPDESEGLVDLDHESQKKVLLKNVNFQNGPISLSLLLGNASRNLVNVKTLASLLRGETLNICQTNVLPTNCAEIMSYYIKRGFQDSRDHPLESKQFNEIGDCVVVLAAEPGMGKSTTLTGLAFELKRHDPAAWIVRINLIECSRRFNQWSEDNTLIDETLAYQFLLDHLKCATSDGSDGLFEQSLCRWYCEQKKIILLVDGYDEVSPDYNRIVLQLLQCYSKKYCAKMWITTRTGVVQNDLSGRFNSFTHFLAPFSTADSEQFLWKFWKFKLRLSDAKQHKCRIFGAKLFELFKNDYDINRFMCVPLQVKMVATVFQNQAKSICLAEGDQVSVDQELPKEMNLVTLYDRFVEITFKNVLEEEKNKIDLTIPDNRRKINIWMGECLEKHKRAGIYATFRESERTGLFTHGEVEAIERHLQEVEGAVEKTGIIYIVDGNVPVFIHRTYGEYFAAMFLWDKYKTLPGGDFEAFVNYYLSGILVRDELNVKLCDFLQMKAQTDINGVLDSPRKSSYLLKRIIETYRKPRILLSHDQKTAPPLMLKIVEFTLSKYHDDLSLHLHRIQLELYSELSHTKFVQILEECAKWGLINLFSLIADFIKTSNKILTFSKSTLFYAGRSGHKEIVQLVLNNGAKPESPVSSGYTLTSIAAENGRLGVVELLLDRGASPNGISRGRGCPLFCATLKGHENVVRLLLDRGADIESSTEEDGITPLVTAATFGHLNLVRLFIERGANVNVREIETGLTALHHAAHRGSEDIVVLLLQAEADVRAVTADLQETPLDYASRKGHNGIVQLLLSRMQ